MRKVGWIVFGTALVFAACSGDGTTPATAPPTSDGPSSIVATTTVTELPSTSLIETTTTTVDRTAEIEAILLDVQARWLEAVVAKDEVAWRSVFANAGFAEYSRPELDFDRFTEMPDNIEVEVSRVIADFPTCIAVTHTLTIGEESQADLSIALELLSSGEWGISYRGEGWVCAGPHPFSP